MTVIFIDGPPGSGKTTLVSHIESVIQSRDKTWAGVVEEGFLNCESPHAPNTVEYSLDWVENRVAKILSMLDSGKSLLFVDSSPWIAMAYHPEITQKQITERLGLLGGVSTSFWFIVVPWETTWERIENRLDCVDDWEKSARVGLRENDYEYMRARYDGFSKHMHRWTKKLAVYHLSTLALSMLAYTHFLIRETVIGIDSGHRLQGSDGDFTIALDRMLQNVVSTEVIAASIPYSVFQINSTNDSFWFGCNCAPGPITVKPPSFFYQIPHGSYTLDSMIYILNDITAVNSAAKFQYATVDTMEVFLNGDVINSLYLDLLQPTDDPMSLARILGFTDLANNTDWALDRTTLAAVTPYDTDIPERSIYIASPELFDGERYADSVENLGRSIICRVPAQYSIEGIQHFSPGREQITTFSYSHPRNLESLRFKIFTKNDSYTAIVNNGRIHITLRILWKMTLLHSLMGNFANIAG